MSELITRMANGAYISNDQSRIVMQSQPGVGPKGALDALELRTGTRNWTIVNIRDGLLTYERTSPQS